jgi:hypothetical protein
VRTPTPVAHRCGWAHPPASVLIDGTVPAGRRGPGPGAVAGPDFPPRDQLAPELRSPLWPPSAPASATWRRPCPARGWSSHRRRFDVVSSRDTPPNPPEDVWALCACPGEAERAEAAYLHSGNATSQCLKRVGLESAKVVDIAAHRPHRTGPQPTVRLVRVHVRGLWQSRQRASMSARCGPEDSHPSALLEGDLPSHGFRPCAHRETPQR